MTNHILKLPAVMEQTGLSRSSIYAFVRKGYFPAPVGLGARSIGWYADSVAEWLERRTPKTMGKNPLKISERSNPSAHDSHSISSKR